MDYYKESYRDICPYYIVIMIIHLPYISFTLMSLARIARLILTSLFSSLINRRPLRQPGRQETIF